LKLEKLNVKKHLKKVKKWIPLCIVLFCVSVIGLYIGIGQVRWSVNQHFIYSLTTEENRLEDIVVFEQGDVFTQDFTAPDRTVGFVLSSLVPNDTFDYFAETIVHFPNTEIARVAVEIIQLDEGTLVASQEVSITQHEISRRAALGREVYLSPGEQYRFVIANISESEKSILHFTQVNDLLIQRDFRFLYIFYLVVVLMILTIVTAVYVLLFVVKNIKLERVYLFIILSLGVLYLLIIRPNGVPDEWHHYDASYNLAYRMMGIDEFEPFDRRDVITTPTAIQGYYNIYQSLRGNAEEISRVQLRGVPANAPAIYHLVPALGIAVGTALNVSNLSIFYLGRFLNLLLFALLSYWALKRMPFGKVALATVCLFPMTIHLAASFSYDGIIIGAALLVIAVIFDILYNKEEVSIKDFTIIALAGLVLVISKGGSYFPIGGLLFLILAKKFKMNKGQLLTMIGVGVLWVAGFIVAMLPHVIANVGEAYAGLTGEPGFSISIILTNWHESLFILLHSFWTLGDFWFLNIIGAELGWFDTPIMMVFIIGFVIFFVLGCFAVRGDLIKVKPTNKLVFALICILSTGLILAGMWLAWTPLGVRTIMGVQGRYFIPLLPLLIGICQTDFVSYKKDINKELMFGVFLLQVFTTYQVIGSSLAH